jgi:CCR4-NOT transcription complex subunit 7/8
MVKAVGLDIGHKRGSPWLKSDVTSFFAPTIETFSSLVQRLQIAMAPPPPIVVREVWEDNLDQEFSEIARVLPYHSFAAFDTEFPGEVFPPNTSRHYSSWSPAESYLHMKRNVDATKIIQLGLTLSNAKGDSGYVWEFNFKGFDKETDLHDLESIQLLEQQGIDLNKNREKGIESKEFVRLIVNSGLLWNSNITWVTFHGAYDFGYLIKILTGRELPYVLCERSRISHTLKSSGTTVIIVFKEK